MTIRYTGAPYHKRYTSRWGPAAYRSDKTACPPEIDEQQVVDLMPQAIERAIDDGNCSLERDGEWPRYVWGRTVFVADRNRKGAVALMGAEMPIIWEARVANAGVPEYKAYPITADRHSHLMPAAVRERLWPQD